MARTKEFPQLGVEVSRSELYRLYWVEELSQSEVADELGINETSAIRAFDELDVPKRDQQSANELANKKKRLKKIIQMKNIFGKSMWKRNDPLPKLPKTMMLYLPRSDIG